MKLVGVQREGEGEMNEEAREEYVVGKKWTTDLRERNNKKE